jgi:hypothetical protein
MYAGPDGTETLRQCSTWEEAHAIAIEIEDDHSATKAITNPNFYVNHEQYMQYMQFNVNYGEQGYPKKKFDGKGKGNWDKPKGVCFDKMRTGACKRGDGCKYSHDKADIEAAEEEKGPSQPWTRRTPNGRLRLTRKVRRARKAKMVKKEKHHGREKVARRRI